MFIIKAMTYLKRIHRVANIFRFALARVARVRGMFKWLAAKLKALLRKAAQRTVDGVWTTIGRLLDTFNSVECTKYFSACGYDPDRRDYSLEPAADVAPP